MGARRGEGGRACINAHAALLAQRHADNFAPNGVQSGGAEHWRFGLLPSAQSPHLLHFAHRAQRHGGIAIGRFGGGDLRDQLGTAQQSGTQFGVQSVYFSANIFQSTGHFTLISRIRA